MLEEKYREIILPYVITWPSFPNPFKCHVSYRLFLVSLTTLLCSVDMSSTALLTTSKSPPPSPLLDASTPPTQLPPSASATSRECRLCAQESDAVVDIFGKEGSERGLPEKVRLCLPVLVCMSLSTTTLKAKFYPGAAFAFRESGVRLI